MNILPLTPANFEEHKKRALQLIVNFDIDDLDPDFKMTLQQGIKTGEHASQCDSCNMLHYLMSYALNKHRLESDGTYTKPKIKYKVEVKTSTHFEDDPQGAMDALEASGFLVFMISDKWYDDKRAQKEWRFAKDMNKPLVFILLDSGRAKFHVDMITPNLIAIIIDQSHDDSEVTITGNYLQAIIAAYKKNLEDEHQQN